MPWIYKKMTECFTSKSADNDTKMSSYTEAGDIALHYIYIVPYGMRSTMYIYIHLEQWFNKDSHNEEPVLLGHTSAEK